MSYARAIRGTRWLAIAVLVLLGTCVFLYHRLQAYSDKVAAQEPRLLRLAVRDALLATRIPEQAMGGVGGRSEQWADIYEPGRPHVIWVVNPNRCLQCLEQLGEWRQIRQRPDVRAVIILEGVGRRGASRIVQETGLSGTVLVDSAARWRKGRGPDEWPGMTVLGVSASGWVQTVASRKVRASCRWSPFVYTLELIIPP